MTPTPVVLPDDLITEILSFLPVKYLLRFKSLSKSFKTLISHPAFAKLHLKRSSTRNSYIALISEHTTEISGENEYDYSVIPYPIHNLIDQPSFTLSVDQFYLLKDKGCFDIVGSCNGLICLTGNSLTDEYREYWLRVWNPATRTISKNIGYFRDFDIHLELAVELPIKTVKFPSYNFKFGCNNSTDTYKVVASRYNENEMTSNVRILSLGDNIWRDIESFPVVPLHLNDSERQPYAYVGVYLNDTLNWLAIHNTLEYDDENIYDIKVEYFVIVSLDLGMETYNQYLLPHGFDEVPIAAEPTICVLKDCLYFSYSYKKTYLVIWHMKEFGVEESWTQFLKISYLQLDYDISDDDMLTNLQLVPLLFSGDGNTLLLESNLDYHGILYNWKDNRTKLTEVTVTRNITNYGTYDRICWHLTRSYVESLVSIC